jgi:hypothetical protein
MVASAAGNALAPNEFQILYAPGIRKILTLLRIDPTKARVTVEPDQVRVRFGWSFQMSFPRDAVTDAGRDKKPFGTGMGVHGWRGRWVVNGSNDGMVRITFRQPQKARVIGFPVKARELFVSLEDPAGFLAAIGF